MLSFIVTLYASFQMRAGEGLSSPLIFKVELVEQDSVTSNDTLWMMKAFSYFLEA
jgi:hypothetical protein